MFAKCFLHHWNETNEIDLEKWSFARATELCIIPRILVAYITHRAYVHMTMPWQTFLDVCSLASKIDGSEGCVWVVVISGLLLFKSPLFPCRTVPQVWESRHRNLKYRSWIKPWGIKRLGEKRSQVWVPKNCWILCYGKFNLWLGTFSSYMFTLRLPDFRFLWVPSTPWTLYLQRGTFS
jgi:hypothetical protein